MVCFFWFSSQFMFVRLLVFAVGAVHMVAGMGPTGVGGLKTKQEERKAEERRKNLERKAYFERRRPLTEKERLSALRFLTRYCPSDDDDCTPPRMKCNPKTYAAIQRSLTEGKFYP